MGYYDDLIKKKKFFNSDGMRMLVMSFDEQEIDESLFSKPWDMSTEVFNETFIRLKKEKS